MTFTPSSHSNCSFSCCHHIHLLRGPWALDETANVLTQGRLFSFSVSRILALSQAGLTYSTAPDVNHSHLPAISQTEPQVLPGSAWGQPPACEHRQSRGVSTKLTGSLLYPTFPRLLLLQTLPGSHPPWAALGCPQSECECVGTSVQPKPQRHIPLSPPHRHGDTRTTSSFSDSQSKWWPQWPGAALVPPCRKVFSTRNNYSSILFALKAWQCNFSLIRPYDKTQGH